MAKGVRMTEAELAKFLKRNQLQERRFVSVARNIKTDPLPPVRESKIEQRLAQQILEHGLCALEKAGPMVRNYFFLPDREFELDFAWPAIKVAVEVQGMAHRIKGKFKRDIEKRALALLAGWRVLEVDGTAIRDGRAISWLRELLNA